MHIPFDAAMVLKFEKLGGMYGSVDRPVHHEVGNVDLSVYPGLLAQHQRTRLIARGNDVALDLAIDAQAAIEGDVAFNSRTGADQAVDAVLRLVCFLAKHGLPPK